MSSRARRSGPGLGWEPASVDALAGLLLLAEMELQLALNPYVHQRLVDGLAAAALSVAVAVRHRWPLGALLVAMAAAVACSALGGHLAEHTVGPIPAVIMLFYGAGAFLPERQAQVALGLGLVGFATTILLSTPTFSDVVFDSGALGGAPWALGRMLRLRSASERAHRQLAERIDAEREQHARTATFGERARIARELHDVIAHSVSVMVIQAGGARVVMGADPGRAEVSLRSVERAGREALAEMRRLLGVLDSGEDPRALAPQPGLADIQTLITRTRAAGLSTELRVEGEAVAISPALDLCAYRIVQEALTNALKHAGPTRAAVRVRWADGALELEVCDFGRGPLAANGGSGGHGIPGMRERAGLHGGSVQVGPGDGAGFSVRARLPLATEGRA